MAPRISTPSAPTAMAAAAARRKSSTVAATSSVDSARGSGISCLPEPVNIWPAGLIAEGHRLLVVGVSGWEMRPTCISWMTMRPSALCTASVTLRQPAMCSSVWMPGVTG